MNPHEAQVLTRPADRGRAARAQRGPAPAAGPPGLRLAPLHLLGERDLELWHDLAASAGEPNPWYGPDFAMPAARVFAAHRPRMLVLEGDDRWLLAFPIGSPRPAALLASRAAVAWRYPWSSSTTPLVRAGYERVAADALAGWARHRLVVFRQLALDGAFAPALLEAAGRAGVSVEFLSRYERAAVQRDPEGRYRLEHRAGKRAADARRRLRALTRDFGPPVVRDRAGDPAAVEDFLTLEASGWKGDASTAFLSDPSHAAAFREVSARMRAAGQLEVLALEAGGELFAMQWNLVAGCTVFTSKVAYDRHHRRYGPGALLDYLALESFHASGHVLLDSCAHPGNEMLNQIYPDRLAMGFVALAGGSAARAGVTGLARFRRVKRRMWP